MKLPILDMKRIGRINSNKKNLIKINTHRTLSNYFLFPKYNISSIYSDNSLKLKQQIIPKEIKNKRKYININNKINNIIKTKIIQLEAKPEIFKVSGIKTKKIDNYMNSYNCKSSNRLNSNDIISTEEYSSKNNNYDKYIKKTLNSSKIKKEISSFIYSSPEKQKKFINFITKKFIKNELINNNKSLSMNINITNRNLKHKYYLKPKNNNEKKINESKDNQDDSDEDKTNLKEFSLLSLIMGNKKEKINQNKAKSLKNSNEKFNKKKLIECWDNNLLKNVLPKYVKAKPNIKLKSTESRNRYNRYKEYSYQSKQEGTFFKSFIIDPLKVNSVDGNLNNKYKYLYKYNFEKQKK